MNRVMFHEEPAAHAPGRAQPAPAAAGRRHTPPRVVASAVLVLTGCVGPNVLGVEPRVAEPGMAVRVTTDRAAFGGPNVTVTVGGQEAPVLRALSETEALVLAPLSEAGSREVVVHVGSTTPGTALPLAVLPAPTTELVLAWEKDQVSLVESHPRSDGLDELREVGGRLVSYDVIDGNGGLVYTGVAAHPTRGRLEVYDRDEAGRPLLHLAEPPASARFAVKIPAQPPVATVRFYELPEGEAASTAEGRARRVLVGEVRVER